MRAGMLARLILGGSLILPGAVASANDHSRAAPVPPALEIEMLDPNADPLGNPAVETVPGMDGSMHVDIPRLVLVHRYYYTGDRSFQYRLIPGGPCILVVKHPRTGEQLYIEAMLPPGAPRVYYDRNSIEYDYGTQGVTLSFGKHGSPKLTYRQGPRVQGAFRTVATSTSRTAGRASGIRLGDPSVNRVEGVAGGEERGHRFGTLTRRAITNTSNTVHAATRAVGRQAAGALRATPLGGLFADPEQRAAQSRNAEENANAPLSSITDDDTIASDR